MYFVSTPRGDLVDIEVSNTTEVPVSASSVGTSHYANTSVATSDYGNTSSLMDSQPQVAPAQINALVYIVAVLLFYSVSIVLLMIKYIKTEEHDCELEFYYNEFVKRDHLTRPSFTMDPRTSQVVLCLQRFNDKQGQSEQTAQKALTFPSETSV